MPSKPPRPCSHVGCAELVTSGSYCATHKTAHEQSYKSDPSKAASKRFYDSALWRKVRQQVLREEPYCQHCAAENRITMATVVDHIERLRAGGSRVARSNLMALCDVCHNKKRWLESQGRE